MPFSGDDVVIIEGLHGLNPLLTQRVGEDKVTRIFASVRSRFTDHDRVLLTPQDVRLMRRMVRDRSTRNTTPEQTMAMWDEVCEGESEYINPYRDSADFKLGHDARLRAEYFSQLSSAVPGEPFRNRS